jgi:hypothetical protein
LRIEGTGGDSLVFHYDNDGEPETYDAKTPVLVLASTDYANESVGRIDSDPTLRI